jgi:glycosyltransferase involved in cell wall biosynthesis
MDVLSFTEDIEVLRPGSPSEERFKKYAEVGKHCVVIVLNTQKERYPMRRVGDNLWIIPTNAPVYPLTLTYSLHLAKKQLFFQGNFQTDLIDAREIGLSAVAAWMTARHFHKPLHIFMRGDMTSTEYGSQGVLNYLKMSLARFILPAADAVSTDSSAAIDSIKELSTSLGDRTILFPRVIDMPSPHSAKGDVNLAEKYPTFKFIMLSVGPLAPQSNHQLAISTLAAAVRAYPHTGLIILGDGPMKPQLQAQAATLNIGDHVAFERMPGDLTDYFKTAQLLINTSTADVFEEVISQAAAASLAIVSTPIGETLHFIKQNENGYLCNVNDVNCFVQTVNFLIHKPEVRERVRLNGMLALQEHSKGPDNVNESTLVKQSWEAALHNFEAFAGTPTV